MNSKSLLTQAAMSPKCFGDVQLTAVKIFVSRLYYHEVIPANFAERLPLPKTSRVIPADSFTLDEFNRMIFQASLCGWRGVRDIGVLEAYLGGALRCMELANLDIKDVDFEKRVLVIRNAKGNKDRVVPISYRTCYQINRYLEFIRPKLAIPESGNALFLANQAKLNSIHGVRDVAILEVFYATGIRRMELANLKISDIDFEKCILSVYQGKGRKDRRVPIAPRALMAVEKYLSQLRPRMATLKSGDYLFLNNEGNPYEHRRVSYVVAKYIRQSSVKVKGACNLFRHTTATLMHENGADIRHVQAMMGHADISTTQIYTHVAIPKLVDVYKKTHPIMTNNMLPFDKTE